MSALAAVTESRRDLDEVLAGDRRLPADFWVDLEAQRVMLDLAEAAWLAKVTEETSWLLSRPPPT